MKMALRLAGSFLGYGKQGKSWRTDMEISLRFSNLGSQKYWWNRRCSIEKYGGIAFSARSRLKRAAE